MKNPLSLVRRFLRHEQGNVLMLTGLGILVLFAVGGAGVDFGRQQLVRAKLQQASDAAALAAASLPSNVSDQERRDTAQRYYNLNYPTSFLGVPRPAPSITIGSTIRVQASASIQSDFVRNVGVQTMNAAGRTAVSNDVTTNTTDYDVLLVMDNSGSMAQADILGTFTPTTPAAARAGAVQYCLGDVTPFYAADCTRSRRQVMADGTQRNYNNANQCRTRAPQDYCNSVGNGPIILPATLGYGLTGNTRLNALRSAALGFVTGLLQEAGRNHRVGTITWATTTIDTQPLSRDLAAVTATLNRMAAVGSTNPVAAMNTVNSLAGSFSTTHAKSLVLLSDGEPTVSGPLTYLLTLGGTVASDGRGCDGNSFCQPAVDQTLVLCTQLKNSGVDIYTIAFGNDILTGPTAPAAQAFLRNCASLDSQGQPRYFVAPDGDTLRAALAAITTSIRKIRISE